MVERVDHLETLVADVMKVVSDILLGLKDSKNPSLERLAYLIKSRVDDRSQTELNIGKNHQGSFDK